MHQEGNMPKFHTDDCLGFVQPCGIPSSTHYTYHSYDLVHKSVLAKHVLTRKGKINIFLFRGITYSLNVSKTFICSDTNSQFTYKLLSSYYNIISQKILHTHFIWCCNVSQVVLSAVWERCTFVITSCISAPT